MIFGFCVSCTLGKMKGVVALLLIFVGISLGKEDVPHPLVSVIQLMPKTEVQLLSIIHLFEDGEVHKPFDKTFNTLMILSVGFLESPFQG